MASAIFNRWKELQWNGGVTVNFSGDTVHVMLINSSAVAAADIDAWDFRNDVVGEVSGSGYTAGGQALGSKTITLNTSGDFAVFDANDTVWSSSTITAGGAVIYKSASTSAAGDPLIALIDFGGSQSSSSGAFTIQWSTAGILRLA